MTGEVKHLRPVPDAGELTVDDDDLALPPGGSRPRRPRRDRPRARPLSMVLRIALLLLLGTSAAFLLAPRLVRGDLPDDPALVGTPARAFVKADRDYTLVDPDATNALRTTAGAKSAPVWDLDVSMSQKDAQVLHRGLVRLAVALEPVRSSSRAGHGDGASQDAAPGDAATAAQERGEAAAGVDAHKLPTAATAAADAVRAVLAGELALVGVEAPRDDVWQALVKAIWRAPAVADAIDERLTDALTQPVVEDKALLSRTLTSDAQTQVVVRVVPKRPGGETRREVADIEDVAGARTAVAGKIAADLAQKHALGEADAESVGAFVAGLVRATLTFNAAETDQRRRDAADAVPPVIVRAHRGELVLRPGEIITPTHHLLVQAMKVQQAGDMRTRAVSGTAFFVGLLCLVVYLFGARRVFRRNLRTKDLAFLSTLLLVQLLGIVAADAITPLLQSAVPEMPAEVLFFAVPVAFGAMTARLTLPPDVALLFSLVIALLGGVVVEPGMEWAVVAMVSSLTGAAGVSFSQRRSTLLLAGAGAGLVGMFAALTLELFRGALVGWELLWLLSATFAGGLLSGLLVLVVTPLVEVLFGYTTEQRLYKLADLNHPLLKDLIVHAPGTWHHSMRTAELAEAAARAVNASPILARVMALYHDVGKMKHPLMFSENQKGDNPHDRLPAEQSAELLRNHVKDGLALAAERGLPKAVSAAIEEHHVDNLMDGFLAKARSATDDDVDERGFRYTGRAPQTRESALVMLADQVEAASRQLDKPTPEGLCGLVDAFVNRAIAEDTLSECELSLKELGRAREALQRALLRMFRQDAA